MDFLGRVFGSAFSGLDFSVIFFWSVFFLISAVAAVFFLAVCETLMSGRRVPRYGWATLVISILSLPVLYWLFVV